MVNQAVRKKRGQNARSAVAAGYNAGDIAPLDEHIARSCGELCGAKGTSDVIDASVVLLAREHHDIIVTSDVDDLRRLDPKSQIVEI
jgi:hypothetical protein